ncbi:Carboxyvinyl-carboxyphosphonate phosphorylmutase [Clavibacter michiganensis subsp. michiganensis]|uniref:Carboxyvinyl-carboxyphosphonate phosphorylmutase n=1 Tax=Clavibacter michiganensis subsp. michiganensis TaxID=33013 RepID=A0A251XK96_CLAMM|nr:Carboxyvinyl-carboxyphosphonate phosphorylmutase [Clavibacter michiganensis subsp. michiganensis]OUE03613.1 Carboxyvinyl-carboxyphosphonate phosphorylmutase [Clavibacter michiganensis subsp. michiganensis]
MWDAITAAAIGALPETKALATASHSIAATFGYEDGERIPLDLHLDMIGRIVAAVEQPVSADLESGYGDAGETVRRAIGVGVVGANLEDGMRPLDDSIRAVEAAVAAAQAEGVPFALNARTDAYVLGGDRDRSDILADAVERTRAYMAAGATTVFVPGPLTEDEVRTLVDAVGPQRLTVIGVPGSLSPPASRSSASAASPTARGPSASRSRPCRTPRRTSTRAVRCPRGRGRSTDAVPASPRSTSTGARRMRSSPRPPRPG